jgi:hypothetical protein
MRANEFLSELIDPKLAQPITWINPSIARSKLTSGREIEIQFEREFGGYVDIAFSVDREFKITGGGNVDQIFATVIQAIKEFVFNNPKLHTITLTANEKSRARAYDTLIKRITPDLGWHVVPHDDIIKDRKYQDAMARGGYLFAMEKGIAPEDRQAEQKPKHGKFKNVWYVYNMDDKTSPQYKVTGGEKAWPVMKYVIDNVEEYKQLNPQLITFKRYPRLGQPIIDLGEYKPS